MRIILIALMCFVCLPLSAQTSKKEATNPTEEFFSKQYDLQTQAYEKKDPVTFQKHFAVMLAKYDKLSKEDKENYKGTVRDSYYNLCCTYSLVNNKPEALKYLVKSIDMDFYDYDHMMKDSDLENIRNEVAYREQMDRVRKIGDSKNIRTNAAAYNKNDTRSFPAFTYQDANSEKLKALRKVFNLDSIAGEAQDVQQVLNLLHWIHNYIPHDGQHGNPTVYDAERMMAVCKKEKRGLNCRGLSTVLNECYLAMGYKSRLVTCQPKDSLKIDSDCHVINSVYVPSLKKWIWVDPTNNAYVMNEKGELLSIEEVRERLVTNKPLILNPDANWNNKNQTTKEDYLDNYMAKNLYRIQCPVNNVHNLEGRDAGRRLEYVELLPLEYYDQKPDKEEFPNEKNKTTFVYYKTNNPDLFWKVPDVEEKK